MHTMPAMRFVLGNRLLDRAGGTEVHLLTLGLQLRRLGHEVCVYSPELGPFTEHVREHGLEVVDDLGVLPLECDVVLSQDTLVVYDLAERYPSAFHVFRVCGDTYDFQFPPPLYGVVDLIVALSDRYQRLARACAVDVPVLRLRVPIDSDRLAPVASIRVRPRRAVLLGNYPDRDELVRDAWERRGVEVRRIGGSEQRYDIRRALSDADIVVAKSRAALDAMACGRAVYVYDVFGGDGWVTPSSYAVLESDHFAGQATDRVIGVAELEADLAGYDPRMGIANRDLVALHHDPRAHAVQFVNAVAGSVPAQRHQEPFKELARLAALQWSSERLARELQRQREALIERLRDVEERAAEIEQTLAATQASAGRAEALEQQVAQMRATRAWRAATCYWSARDRLLTRLGSQGPT